MHSPDSRAQISGDPLLHLAILYPGRLIRGVQVDIIETREQEHTYFYLVRKADPVLQNFCTIQYYPDVRGTGGAEMYTVIATSDEYTCIDTQAKDAWIELDLLEQSPRQEQLWDLGL